MVYTTKTTTLKYLLLYKMPSKKTQRKHGSRASVWRGGAEMTVGGLRKEDLTKNSSGRIVSKKKSQTMKKKIGA